MRNQLKTKEKNCEKLEFKIVSLKRKWEKIIAQLNRNLKNEKILELLDDIIKSQKPMFERSGIDYEEGKSSKKIQSSMKLNKEKYFDVLRSPTKVEINRKMENQNPRIPPKAKNDMVEGSPFCQGKHICPHFIIPSWVIYFYAVNLFIRQ